MLGNHYDSRYHKGIDTYEDRRFTQSHMLRAYFTFFAESGMETWLAHGTLLGWWWNGKMLPWDWDIDTQVSESTLNYMGKHHNGTMYNYVSKDGQTKRTYLLDVNPAIVERVRGNGNNVIDARWIDTSNGLYIDITGLSETHPDDRPGVWSCKNYHRYHTTDLYPMRDTLYEGVGAKVPYAYDRILIQEYKEKALIVTEYEGHRWNADVKEWIKKSEEELKAEKEAKAAAKQKEKEEKQKLQAEKNKQQQDEKAKQEQDKQPENKQPENNQPENKQPENKPEEVKVEENKEEVKPEDTKQEGQQQQQKRDLPVKRYVELEKETSGLAHLRRKRDMS